MKDNIVAKRYARGLFKSVKEKEDIQKIGEDLESFAVFLNKKKSFFIWLTCVENPASKRIEKIKTALTSAAFHKMAINFLSLLIKRERIKIFGKIYEEFAILCDETEKKAKGELIAVSAKIAAEFKDKVEVIISKKINKKVALVPKGDPSIIGGLKISVGNKVLDMTIKKRFSDIKERLCLSEQTR